MFDRAFVLYQAQVCTILVGEPVICLTEYLCSIRRKNIGESVILDPNCLPFFCLVL